MKTRIIPALVCALALLTGGTAGRADVVLDWSMACETAPKVSGQTKSGQARADGIFREALVNTVTGIPGRTAPARPVEDVSPCADLDAAASQAAFTALRQLYPAQSKILDMQPAGSLAELTSGDQAATAGRAWGRHVAETVLDDHETDMLFRAYMFSEAKAPEAGHITPDLHSETTGPGSYTFTTLAGSPGSSGSTDGIGSAARFNDPSGLAVDKLGNVYVADRNNYTIRKIAPGGAVTTLAGLAGSPGSIDGAGSEARFKLGYPGGLAVDDSGNAYVADTDNHTIRKITPAGEVSTFAGSPGNPGWADGSGSDARFNYPTDVAVDPAGNILVADGYYPSAGIRKITPDGVVTTLDLAPLYDFAPSYGFSRPRAVTVDGAGNVYVLEYDELFGNFLFKFTLTAGGAYMNSAVASGWSDPTPVGSSYSAFAEPTAMALDGTGNLLVVDGSGYIRRFTPSGEIQTPRLTAYHLFPSDLIVDGRGNVYLVSSYTNSHTVQIGAFEATALVITQEPISQGATIGDTVTFTVEVAGDPTPILQWYHDATALNGATSPALTLSNVQLADAGYYTVTATNSSGRVTSYPALLVVNAVAGATPPSPAGNSTPGASSGGGGASSGWYLGALAVLFAARGLRAMHPTSDTLIPNQEKI